MSIDIDRPADTGGMCDRVIIKLSFSIKIVQQFRVKYTIPENKKHTDGQSVKVSIILI